MKCGFELCAQKIAVEPGFFADRSGLLCVRSQRNGDGIIGVPGRDQRRDDQLALDRIVLFASVAVVGDR